MTRACAVLMWLALVLATGARAADIPEQFLGLYGKATCRDSRDYSYSFPWGKLVFADDYIYMNVFEYEDIVEGDNWWRFDISTEGDEPSYLFVRKIGDDVQEIARRPVGKRTALEPFPLPPSDWPRERWLRCSDPPDDIYLLFGEAFSFLDAFEGVRRQCVLEDSGECAGTLFRFADVTGNEGLSAAEINRAIRIAVFFGMLKRNEISGVSRDELAGSYAVAALIGGPVSAALLAAFDYDGSGELELGEVVRDRERILDPRYLKALGDGERVKGISLDVSRGLQFLQGLLGP